MRAVFGTLGLGFALLCAMMLAIAVSSLATGEDPETARSTLVGLVVLFIGGTWFGLQMAKNAFRWSLPALHLPKPSWPRSRNKQQEVLGYATSVGGRVTVVEVAGRCHLPLEESEAILNDFA